MRFDCRQKPRFHSCLTRPNWLWGPPSLQSSGHIWDLSPAAGTWSCPILYSLPFLMKLNPVREIRQPITCFLRSLQLSLGRHARTSCPVQGNAVLPHSTAQPMKMDGSENAKTWQHLYVRKRATWNKGKSPESRTPCSDGTFRLHDQCIGYIPIYTTDSLTVQNHINFATSKRISTCCWDHIIWRETTRLPRPYLMSLI